MSEAMKLYKIWKNGVFGRLDCKGGARALKKNRIFFHFWRDALRAGMRPCKNCKPVRRIEEEKAIKRKEVKK